MPTCFGAIHRIESDPNCNFKPSIFAKSKAKNFKESGLG